MRDLDTRTQDVVKKINDAADDYMKKVNDMDATEKVERFHSIHTLFGKAKDFSDDKVQLAMQTYEMVDKHIRRLDSELVKLEAEMKDKQMSGSSGHGEEPGKKKGNRARDRKGANQRAVIEDSDVRKTCDLAPHLLELLPPPGATGNEVLDMPVDPNEPTYCICHQVSYGEMIGCDNPDCPIEWFHFACVGLTTKPKGKWFCPKCTSDRKKK